MDDDFVDADENIAESSAEESNNHSPKEVDDEWTQMQGEIVQVEECLRLFLNSRFGDAETILKSREQVSIYHSVGLGIIRLIKALFTFEAEDVKLALGSMKNTLERAKSLCPKTGVMSMLTRTVTGVPVKSWKKMSTVEKHATLICAEVTICKAVLTLMADDGGNGFVTLVKESVNINQSYNSYKQAEILTGFADRRKEVEALRKRIKKEQAMARKNLTKTKGVGGGGAKTTSEGTEAAVDERRPSAVDDRRNSSSTSPISPTYTLAKVDGSLPNPHNLDPHFMGGIALGSGLFNVLFSLLPERVLRLFEFIGFGGNRIYGLSLLRDASLSPEGGIRQEICAISTLFYHTIVGPYLLTPDYDIDLADQILRRAIILYPESFIFRYFQGRMFYIKGHLEKALECYEKSRNAQREWKQLHHIVYWDSMVTNLYLLNYEKCYENVKLLSEESKWSRCMYCYLKATFLYMNQLKANKYCNGPGIPSQQVIDLYGEVNKLRRKVAGKSIPVEKFVARKARKFAMQGNRLILPVIEFMMLWNGLGLVDPVQRTDFRDNVVHRSLKELEALTPDARKAWVNWADDVALCRLGMGSIFVAEKNFEEGSKWFRLVIEDEDSLILDHWMAPWARVQLAYSLIFMESYQEALEQLVTAKKKYKNYSLENATQIRLQNCLNIISIKTTLNIQGAVNGTAATAEPDEEDQLPAAVSTSNDYINNEYTNKDVDDDNGDETEDEFQEAEEAEED